MAQTLVPAIFLLVLVVVFCAAAAAVSQRWNGRGSPSLLARAGASIRGGVCYRLVVAAPGTSGYLAKMAVLSFLVSACLAAPAVGSAFVAAQTALAHLPRFELSGGAFHADVPQPFVRRTPRFEFIIDTTGRTGPQALAARPGGALITAHRLYVKRSPSGTTIYDFSHLSGLTVDRRTVQRLGLAAMRWGIPVVGLLVGAAIVGLAFWRALVVAILLLVLSRIGRRRHDWRTAWGVAAHAWTIPLALGPFHALLHIDGLLYWSGAIAYAVVGLHAIQPPPAGPAKPDSGAADGTSPER